VGRGFQGARRPALLEGGEMKNNPDKNFIEETVVIDGVTAVRRRKAKFSEGKRSPYLHVPMECMSILANADLPPSGWKLAIWILWHHRVSSGEAATISATFANRAGLTTRATRRYAVDALEETGLFDVIRKGKAAARINLGAKLKSALKKNE
jgi:hypothetical protein